VNVVVWIIQVALALAFLLSGLTKVSRPRETLVGQMKWVEDFSDRTVKVIGGLEILGAIGIVLPAWTGIARILTPLAATGLAALMVAAASVHLRRKESSAIVVNAVLFALAAVVAIDRFATFT
jgi:uncharacterized membrane protein